MSLNATTLYNAMKNGFDTLVASKPPEELTAQEFHDDLASTLNNYFTNNMVVNFSWTGVQVAPPFNPDPITSFTASISYISFSLSPVSNTTLWGIDIATQISGGILTCDDVTFIIVLPSLINIPVVVSDLSNKTNYEETLTQVASDIISTVTTMVNPTPTPGTRLGGVYTGTAVMISIT